MKYLPHSLVLCFGVVALTGCPGDDDDGSDRRDSNGGIDEADVAGKGAAAAGKGAAAAGKGAAAAGKGASEDADGGVTADQATADVCQMMGEMAEMDAFVSPDRCTGLEEYAKCTDETCGSGDCYDGDCKDLLDCYADAEDRCNADCKPSSACTACLSDVGTCATEMCIKLVKCGETEAGGACDQLDECCESLSGSAKMLCETAAETSRSGGGDKLCESIKTSLCQD